MTVAWLVCVFVAVASLSFPFVGDNKLYNFLEKGVVGIVTGHTLVMGINAFKNSSLAPLAKGRYVVLFPVALGLLFIFRLVDKQRYLAQYPACLTIGVGIGLGLRTVMRTEILKQVGATAALGLGSVRSALILLIVLSVVIMQLFTDRAGKWLGRASTPLRTIGRWAVMLSLGSIWASTIFDRLNLLSTVMIKKIMEVFVGA